MKSIIILGAGIMQLRAIQTAKDLGFYVIAADKDKESVSFEYVDLKLTIDTKDTKPLTNFELNNKA